MGDGNFYQYPYQPQPQLLLHQPAARQPRAPPRQRATARGGAAGEIVEVQGGHIVRATGRKDRHSKVCTAKGPRDRRVRLSAHTAIQFYDVQDRLGYDRPSKAVDWLIKNAKSAIDELAQLPPWRPSANDPPTEPDGEPLAQEARQQQMPPPQQEAASAFGIIPSSLESDAIADTIKFFIPVAGGSGASSSHSIGYQPQDVRLSLQSLQDLNSPMTEQTIFSSSSATLAFDAASHGWSEQNPTMAHWASAGEGGGGGYMFQVPTPFQQTMGEGPFLTQRCPLQSNSNHSVHAASAARQQLPPRGFGPGLFSGFRVPARIQGEEEHDVGAPLHLLLAAADRAKRKSDRE